MFRTPISVKEFEETERALSLFRFSPGGQVEFKDFSDACGTKATTVFIENSLRTKDRSILWSARLYPDKAVAGLSLSQLLLQIVVELGSAEHDGMAIILKDCPSHQAKPPKRYLLSAQEMVQEATIRSLYNGVKLKKWPSQYLCRLLPIPFHLQR
ncbi:hypothetical protein C8R41DRAFT_870039 [Lentinula lateritia]|uniref:Uncharacterized protein n=1 Tax=Lentinula lateritia TaxID=40482 RepID=A0ABQ8V887_9AGAR|nr:hypothetical protein C8R41DRAFT_870039 [Lentinula lateritia]